MTPLSSERLVLRDFVAGDEAAVHEYASDPVVTRFTDWGPNTVEATHEFVAMAAAQAADPHRRSQTLAVTLRATGRLIGGANIDVDSEEHRRGELGYVINPAYWSQRYATEATRRLLAFGFEELGLHRIVATCEPENRASARVLEKAGFRLEGRMRDHMRANGQWRDSLLYAVVDAR